MERFVLLAVLVCCSIKFSHCCNINAPEIVLSERHSGCNSNLKSRNPDCVAAMHRYCNEVSFPTEATELLGVSRESFDEKIDLSCVKAHWYGDVSISELHEYHSECELDKSQHRDCLSAIHRYCMSHFGSSFAGTSQVKSGVLQVHCFQSSRKEDVLVSVLKNYHDGCNWPDSDSDTCYSAASRWCNALGHSGGITQEVLDELVKVACYHAEFSNGVFTIKTNDFYKAEKTIRSVCSLDFTIDHGKILSTTPQLLKMETYDNRGSSVTLYSTFEVSKDITTTNSFTHEHSFSFGASTTISAEVPFFGGGVETTLSTTYSGSVSLSETNSVTVSYSSTSNVDVPPGKAIVKTAVLTRVNLDVPWTAKIVSELGTIKFISGTWQGVNTFDFKVAQDDLADLLQLINLNA